MNTQKIIPVSSKVFIAFSILSIGYVSVLSLFSPQATMALVGMELTNTDAISSIRGIYGGVGLAITLSLVFLLMKEVERGLAFLMLFWGFYAGSRVITIAIDGPLGDFGTQWLTIESILFLVATALFLLQRKSAVTSNAFARN